MRKIILKFGMKTKFVDLYDALMKFGFTLYKNNSNI